MTKAVAKTSTISAQTLSTVLLHGDLSVLKPEELVSYYSEVCKLIGINPTTKPFDYIVLNGKKVLYANKGCAEQLRELHRVSLEITKVQTIDGVYVVVVSASLPDGRKDSGTGAVNVVGLKGEALANAFMKCETKAKRRATLSICGLNMLDETEVESIHQAERESPQSKPAGLIHPTPAPNVKIETPAPGDFDYQPPQGRTAIGKEIILLGAKLKLSKQQMIDWVKEDFNKKIDDLTETEMLHFLESLQKEIGRA